MQTNKARDFMLKSVDFPGISEELLDSYNVRLKALADISVAMSKEYHTAWLVKLKDRSMELFRNIGENNVAAVEQGLKCRNYDCFIQSYLENNVVGHTAKQEADLSFENITEIIKDGNLHSFDYVRKGDDGVSSYYQICFALAGKPEEAEYFVMAFKDVDVLTKSLIAEKHALQDQLNIMAALARDYYNIFRVDLLTGEVVILKLDGYVTQGMEGAGEKKYPYDVLYKQYVKDRVYVEDIPDMMNAMSLETVRQKMHEDDTYEGSYRVHDKGEIHYYLFTYLPIKLGSPDEGVLAGFKNADDIVASAKEREELVAKAEMDLMTGILNRGSGESKVIKLLNATQNGMMCIIDIDKFKHFNDTYGHDIGDKVIIAVANIISSEFREDDIVFRLGGDEFAAYAKGIHNEAAGRAVVARIFDKLANLRIPGLEDVSVSISVGAAIRDPENDRTFEDIYRKADAGVFLSKKTEGSALSFYKESAEEVS
jgi:diguanylate cyclase (GGDEF)-like protein